MRGFDRLHPTQEKLLDALARLADERPSLRRLGREIGILSPNTIAYHLEQLQRKGYLIVHEDGACEIVEAPLRDIAYIPLYGSAACGPEEFFAEENIEERIPLPTRSFGIGPDYFLIRARGDSMEPRIHDGDLVLIQPKTTVVPDAMMVVGTGEGAVVKQVTRAADAVTLRSLNPEYPPRALRPSERPHVIGLVRGIIHTKIS